MAILPSSTTTETLDDRNPVPAGKYVATIVKSEIKDTKAKNGHFLALRFKIQEGESAGKLIFNNLNYDNPNPVAVEIAFKTLNSIKAAVGLDADEGEDTEELHGIPMLVTVVIRQGNGQYPPSNEITGYEPIEGAVPETSSEATAAPQKPWE